MATLNADSSSRGGLSILIVGGGPVGLALAAGLAKTNPSHKVTVLERHPDLQSRGGPVQIHQGAINGYKSMGLYEALMQATYQGADWYWSLESPDAPLGEFEVVGAAGGWLLKRVTLRDVAQRFAYHAGVQNGVEVLFDKSVVEVDEQSRAEQGQVVVRIADGAEYAADLVVGADGVKSRVRTLVFGDEFKAVGSKTVVFHSIMPRDRVRADAKVKEAGMTEGAAQGAHFTMGPGLFNIVAAEDLPNPKTFAYSCVLDYGERPHSPSESWYVPGDPDELRRLYAGFPPKDRACLEYVEGSMMWKIGVAPHMSSWRGQSGRVVLVGDAAHAMQPHMGQGLTQGIEGAAELCRFLRDAQSSAQVPGLTEAWEKLRRPRAERVVGMADESGRLMTLAAGQEQRERDERLRRLWEHLASGVRFDQVKADAVAPWYSLEQTKWLEDYDPFGEVDKYLKGQGGGVATRER
jgi:salicylate hydroxylase